MSGGRDPRATAEYLQTTLGHGKAAAEKSESGLHVFATYLFTHNSRVSILSFALGFAFGVPTLMLEYYQGIGLGAMMAVFSAKGLAFDLDRKERRVGKECVSTCRSRWSQYH